MAFHWQTFQTRALSAIVFVAVMAVGLLWNKWSFAGLFFIVHVGCWIEYYKLVKKIHPVDERAGKEVAFLIALVASMLLAKIAISRFANDDLGITEANLDSNYDLFIPELLSDIILEVGIVALAIKAFMLRKRMSGRFFFAMLMGMIYITLSLALLIQLRLESYPSPHWALAIPLLIIFTNWVNDTMAYLVGSLIGKTPFSPISPKKTWEGTIGGAVLAVVVMSLIAYFSGVLPVGHTAALSAICAVTGTYGDLMESKLKRLAGVKDSGTVMPGHGGFLDRFDSLLFSATAGALYVWLIMA